MAEGRKLEGLGGNVHFQNAVLEGLMNLKLHERRGGSEMNHFRAVFGLAVAQALRGMGVEVPRPYAGVVREFLRDVRIPEDMFVRLSSLISPPPGTQVAALQQVYPSFAQSLDRQKPDFQNQLRDILQLRLLCGGLDMWEQFLLQARETNLDPLTQLLNRRGLEHYIQFILKQDPNAFGAVVFLDVDHFKRVNDQYGHSLGDSALKHVSGVFERAIRIGSDELFRVEETQVDRDEVPAHQLARYGGEEILAVLPGVMELSDAADIANRVRREIERTAPDALGFPLTATMGVTVGPLSNTAEMLKYADQLLYEGKKDGRNRVVAKAYPKEGKFTLGESEAGSKESDGIVLKD